MGAGKDLDTRDRRRIRQVGLKPNDDGVFVHEVVVTKGNFS